jgi:pimeloyl-ACP methyl ester carboxylesterase
MLPKLVEKGHEIYALDWLGHGRSDKMRNAELISFELHMQTLRSFFKHVDLQSAHVVAHDWGG